ncbi:MAG: hypothetical protein Sapg2KO_45270 [Saprospiraceae bacterium]
MRSIAREDLSTGFEMQIINELAKRPWRQNTIKALEAEFQVIKGQYKANIILEGEARRRMACELAKYLHQDYLTNFDQQSIFSPESTPFKFYSYVRQNNLWRNLGDDEIGLEETTEEAPVNNPALFDQDERESLVQPKKTNNLNLINILYWTFLVACGWVLLSLILGTFLKNQRFRNPVTQQIFEVLLLPFQLIKPLLTEKTKTNNTFYGLEKQAYGTPLSEDKIKTLIDSRIAQTTPNLEATAKTEDEQDRLASIETQLAWLQKQKQEVAPVQETPTPEEGQLIKNLQLRLEELTKKVDLLSSKLDQQTSQMPSKSSSELSVNNLSQVRQIVTQEISDFNLDLDKRIKALELKNTKQAPIQPVESDPTPPEADSPGLSVEDTNTTLEIEEIETPPLEEIPTAESIAPAEQLDLPPLPSPLMPQFIYYASSPQKGVFYGRRLENGFISKQTVYKITVDKENPTQASFTLVTDEATIRLALNILDSYILPAMELRGPGKIADATDIGPVEPGLLQKEGENWKIVKKGVLHYH